MKFKIIIVGSIFLAGCAYYATADGETPEAIVTPLYDEVEVEYIKD